jgi:hypothetical protein
MLVEDKAGNLGKKVERARLSGVITERDLQALSWVISQGVMTVDQIYRAIYSSRDVGSSRHAYRRVQFLVDAGYLTAVTAAHKKDRFLKATKRAQHLLEVKSVPDVTRMLHVPTLAEIPHAEVLTEIRIAIAKAGKHGDGLWWRSEGSLLEDESFPAARFRDLMPDALWITKSGKRVAIVQLMLFYGFRLMVRIEI